jgi:NAD(P)-dependent dehydrogenase (short-subunit alcohol dehydrogenase family)
MSHSQANTPKNAFQGRVAIVTGGGSGIGRAVALLLAQRGAAVAVGDIAGRNAALTAAEVVRSGGQALHEALDVSVWPSVKSLVERVLARWNTVDILVNNAGGVVSFGTAVSCNEADWDRTLAINLKGAYLVSKAVLPSMIEKRRGAIVNLGSTTGLLGYKNLAAYSASKGGIIALTRAMAADFAQYNVRVNCVCPGPTLTPPVIASLKDESARQSRALEQPLGRLGEPEDVAEAVAYLASDDSSWVTGVTLPVDGGRSIV